MGNNSDERRKIKPLFNHGTVLESRYYESASCEDTDEYFNDNVMSLRNRLSDKRVTGNLS